MPLNNSSELEWAGDTREIIIGWLLNYRTMNKFIVDKSHCFTTKIFFFSHVTYVL